MQRNECIESQRGCLNTHKDQYQVVCSHHELETGDHEEEQRKELRV